MKIKFNYLKVFIVIFTMLLLNSCNMNNSNKKCEVTFDSDGGTSVPSQTLEVGDYIVKPDDPVKNGYIFDGWYLKEVLESNDCEITPWLFPYYTVSKDITLKAKWVVTSSIQSFITMEEWEQALSYNNFTIIESSGNEEIRLVNNIMYFIEDGVNMCLYNQQFEEDVTFASFFENSLLGNMIDLYEKLQFNGEHLFYVNYYEDVEIQVDFYVNNLKQISKIVITTSDDEYNSELIFSDYGTTYAPVVDHRILDPHVEIIDDIKYNVYSCGCGKVSYKEKFDETISDDEHTHTYFSSSFTPIWGETLSYDIICDLCGKLNFIYFDKELTDAIYTLKNNTSWCFYSEIMDDGLVYEHYYNYETSNSYYRYLNNNVIVSEGLFNNQVNINYQNGNYTINNGQYGDYWKSYIQKVVNPLYDYFYEFQYVEVEGYSKNDGWVSFRTNHNNIIEDHLGMSVTEFFEKTFNGIVPDDPFYMTISFKVINGIIVYPVVTYSTTDTEEWGIHFGIEREFYSIEQSEELLQSNGVLESYNRLLNKLNELNH